MTPEDIGYVIRASKTRVFEANGGETVRVPSKVSSPLLFPTQVSPQGSSLKSVILEDSLCLFVKIVEDGCAVLGNCG